MDSKITYLFAVKDNEYRANCINPHHRFDDEVIDFVEVGRTQFEELENVLDTKRQVFTKLHIDEDFNKEIEDITTVKMVEYLIVLFVDDIVTFVE